VGPGVRFHELGAVVHSDMRVTLKIKIVVRTLTITEDRSAGFDPVTYDVISVLADLSCTGTRKVSPDTRSPPPNTH
jgi:hypothetical protein